jgi:rod shape determining protein RodA
MEQKNGSLFKSIDWWTIAIYIALVVFGWFSICGASYTYGEVNFFDFDVRSGKQAVWICCSLGLGFVLLMLEEKLYEMFAYILYGAMLVLLFLTPFVAEDTKGSLSWIKLGPVSLQPAEFAKFATALALAKYMGTYGFSM